MAEGRLIPQFLRLPLHAFYHGRKYQAVIYDASILPVGYEFYLCYGLFRLVSQFLCYFEYLS